MNKYEGVEKLSPSIGSAAKTLYATFEILKEAGGELPSNEILELIPTKVELSDWEKEQYEKTGKVRWQVILQFYTIDCSKAGYLRKQKGIWYLTEEGEKILSLGAVELLKRASKKYHKWDKDRKSEIELDENVNYWLYAPGRQGVFWAEFYKAGVMGIGWDYLGDFLKFGSKENIAQAIRDNDEDQKSSKKNNASACYSFAHDIQIGDIIYAKVGVSRIVGQGIVRSDYIFDDSRDQYKHLRKVEWTSKGDWTVNSENKFALKTLTKITKYKSFLAYLESLITKVPDDSRQKIKPVEPYDSGKALKELFISKDGFKNAQDLLRYKKNIILQGSPGVGKTFLAKRLAYSIMGVKDTDRVEMIQFHQSYSYEDFIQGYRPNSDGKFVLKNGMFYQFCRRALYTPNESFFFIIDEINRGNLSKIFGELMMLIECDKRGETFAVPLTYSEKIEDRFFIPDNVHIIGTMNTADRSLAMVDYALRRRFCFIELQPEFNSEKFKRHLSDLGADAGLVNRISSQISVFNEKVSQDNNLGPGFKIGHSFFCPTQGTKPDNEWYERVIRTEIAPLIREYWFDHPEKADKEINNLLA